MSTLWSGHRVKLRLVARVFIFEPWKKSTTILCDPLGTASIFPSPCFLR